MPDNRKYAIYSRKSKFTGKGESIENQIEICRRALKSKYDVVDEDIVEFEDEGFSGGNTKRPKFQEMMERCRNGEFQLVICYRLDRISRNTSDFVNTYEELKEHSVCFRSVSDNIDDTSPMGRAMMMISSVFAQLERDIIAERITDNMHELAKSGRWLGGNPPTGYRSAETVGSITVDGKIHKARMLEKNPEEAELVGLVFTKFVELRSITKVETYLLNNDLKSKKGNTLSRFAIKTILQNPVYAIADEDTWVYLNEKDMQLYGSRDDFDGIHGIMAYNKTIQKKGRSMKQKTPSEWIVAVGKHEGIIEGKRWVEVQHLLEKNRDKAYRKPKNNTALLSGLLFCACCGSFMRPKLSSRVNKQGEKVYDYLCELKERSHGLKCDNKRINGNELDRQICDEIKHLGEDDSGLMKLLRNSQKSLNETFADSQAEIDRLTEKKKQYEAERTNLVKALTLAGETMAAEDIISQINDLHTKTSELEMQISEHRRLMENSDITNEQYQSLADMLSSFAKTIDTLDVMKKRDVIRCFVRRVEWDGENIHLYLMGAESGGTDVLHSEPERECSKRDTYAFSLAEKDGE